jgi:MoxR-like ATPase
VVIPAQSHDAPARSARPEPTAVLQAEQLAQRLRAALAQVLRGKPGAVQHALVALLSGGHLLIDDVPGVGKTLLAKSIARSLGGSFHRVQSTPDLLPTELTGVSVFDIARSEWTFRPGPLFANVVLVDELNRATPRTQAALLEAMEERQVTIDGTTRALPQPFFLVATQNPHETAGTFPLVEGQLDRFALVTEIGVPDARTERELLLGTGGEPALANLEVIAQPHELANAITAVGSVFVADALADYVVAVATATRTQPDIAIGASPRASISWLRGAQAFAVLDGRDYVVPDDLQQLAVPCLAHRLVLHDLTRLHDARAIVAALLDSVPVPRP